MDGVSTKKHEVLLMATRLYEFISTTNNEELAKFCRDVARIREEDVEDFSNLTNVFMRGRKVGKIPSSSADTTGDRVGDFNYDTSYLYICVDNSGTATWRRATLGSW